MALLGTNVDKKHKAVMDEMMQNRLPVVDECRNNPTEPCSFLEKGSDFCTVYINPKSRWRLGPCPLATHVSTQEEKPKTKIRVGQQKQRRR